MINLKKMAAIIFILMITLALSSCGRQGDTPAITDDFEITTAAQWVAGIRVGWNLGNTLDTVGDGSGGFPWLGGGLYANTTVAQMETAWGNPITTRAHITTLREAGFNAIRIPVSWNKAVCKDFYIREDWMARVKQVVGYAADNDMYIILNTHHDNTIFRLLDEHIEDSKFALERIWSQIAYAFRDHNHKLAFGSLNEPRTHYSPNEWTGGTPEERSNLNILNQLFVDTVRATGGNNAQRVLIIPTYAASAAAVAQRWLIMPTDTVEDRIVVTLHIYSPWGFALRTGLEGTTPYWDRDNPSDTRPMLEPLDLAYETFVSNGIPVFIGEMGALNRGNTQARAQWAEFFVYQARLRGMPCFWWDNGIYRVTELQDWGGWDETFGILNRNANEIAHPEIVEALMRATS